VVGGGCGRLYGKLGGTETGQVGGAGLMQRSGGDSVAVAAAPFCFRKCPDWHVTRRGLAVRERRASKYDRTFPRSTLYKRTRTKKINIKNENYPKNEKEKTKTKKEQLMTFADLSFFFFYWLKWGNAVIVVVVIVVRLRVEIGAAGGRERHWSLSAVH